MSVLCIMYLLNTITYGHVRQHRIVHFMSNNDSKSLPDEGPGLTSDIILIITLMITLFLEESSFN